MNKILTEAIVVQSKKNIQLALLINEAIKDPVFKGVKKFENELEINLLFESKNKFQNEVLSRSFGPPPRGFGPRTVALGGSGRFGKATKPLNNLMVALSNAKMDSFDMMSKFDSELSAVLKALDPVVDLLKDEDPEVKKQATILVYKVYVYLENMLNMLVEANKKLQAILPSDFSVSSAAKMVRAATEEAERAAREADEYEAEKLSKEKEGIGSKILRGIRKIFGGGNK